MSEPKIKVAKEIEDGYKIGVWSGFPNYECIRCPFKITNLDFMIDHVNEHKEREKFLMATGVPWEEVHDEGEYATTPTAEELPAPTESNPTEKSK